MIIDNDITSDKVISGIYCIENLINGKKYIGFSENIYTRWKAHIYALNGNYHRNYYLNHAWNKYGKENFKFWIIEEFDYDIKLLKLMETYFIVYYNSYYDNGEGYNLSMGGEGFLKSQETRKKISKKLSGKNSYLFGKQHSEETKQKMSKTHKLYVFTDEHKMNISKSVSIYLNENRENYIGENNPFYGKKHSKEQKQKWSKQRRGKRNGGEKLTVEIVLEIKKMLRDGVFGSEISKIFNTSRSNISSIKNGYTWRDVSL